MGDRQIARPLGRLTQTMGRLADRDWSAEIEGGHRRDEVGAMAKAVQVFKRNGIEPNGWRLNRPRRT